MEEQVGGVEGAAEKALHMHPGDLQHPARPIQRFFDVVTAVSGHPACIITFLIVTTVYLIANHAWLHFDTQLTLYTAAISIEAIFLAQVILNSQGRQAEIESRLSRNSYAQVAEIDQIVKSIDSVQDTQLTLLREVRELQDQLTAHVRRDGHG
jgi:uncharacterized membrane protein